jgi:hypothetical protein
MNILALSREEKFSPGLVSSDAAILQAVVERLRAAGHECTLMDECALAALPDAEVPPVVLHMARRADTLQRLETLAAAGHRVLNDPQGIRRCAREAMTRCLTEGGIPQPAACSLPTAELWFAHHPEWRDRFPGWLKRGDLHAVHAEDVAYVATPEEADTLLAAYRRRGIERVVYNEHLHGDLVKFYGVAGTDFFHWFYPLRTGHSKFGLEQRNDAPADIPFSAEALRTLCHRAARLLGVSIYGGDCIIAPDGTARIIDFNDWPSFAPCRDAAADAITQIVTSI